MDVAFAIDISRSMNVRDLSPSRLSRAVAVAREVVEASPGIRFAAALGKGTGVLAVPLTDDAESLFALFNAVSSSVLSAGGTDLEHLVDAASAAFTDTSPSRRVIVLLTDGESLSGSLAAAAERAAAVDIALVAVGVGTAAGGPVPVDVSGKESLRSEDGRPVVSSLHESELRSVVAASGGAYVAGNRADAGAALASLIASVASVDTTEGFRREAAPRSSLFTIAALAAFALSKLIESGLRRKR